MIIPIQPDQVFVFKKIVASDLIVILIDLIDCIAFDELFSVPQLIIVVDHCVV